MTKVKITVYNSKTYEGYRKGTITKEQWEEKGNPVFVGTVKYNEDDPEKFVVTDEDVKIFYENDNIDFMTLDTEKLYDEMVEEDFYFENLSIRYNNRGKENWDISSIEEAPADVILPFAN